MMFSDAIPFWERETRFLNSSKESEESSNMQKRSEQERLVVWCVRECGERERYREERE